MWNKSVSDQKQIAIVGAGFGGCSTAYFLRCLMGNTLGIRIFEHSNRIGGRVRAIRYNNGKELYESGGAIFTSNNKYMHKLAKEFRLELLQHPPPDGALCLYNGYLAPPAFFTKDGPLRLNRFRFAVKYLFDYFRFKSGVIRHVKEFSQVNPMICRLHVYDSSKIYNISISALQEMWLNTKERRGVPQPITNALGSLTKLRIDADDLLRQVVRCTSQVVKAVL
ncbi:hypothetical protein ACTXT7_005503 [Hymenolepis weldensis]